MRMLAATAVALISGCGPAGLGQIGDTVITAPESAVVAWHQDGRGMVVLSDLPDLCERFADNPSDPPTDDAWWVVSATATEPLTAGTVAPAAGYAQIVTGGVPEEHVATEASVVITAQDAAAGTSSGQVELYFGDDRLRATFQADLCATSALFIGQE